MTNPRTRGFTLIEMLIVVTIIGIVSGFGLPRMNELMKRESTRSARREVVTLVSRARNTAAQRGCRSTLHISASTDQVWVTSCKLTGTGRDTIGTVLNTLTRYKVLLAADADSLPFAANSLGLGTGTISFTFTRDSYSNTMRVSSVGRATW